MDIRVKNRNVRWLIFVDVLVISGCLCYGAVRHGIAEYWAGSSNPDLWLRAAELEPANAGTWYLLGRYRELDFEHADLPLAISYYQRAATIEPVAALYWMELAGAYETNGDPIRAEQAYRTAKQDYPISPEVSWRYGNFLLRQGHLDEAFDQIRHALTEDPSLTALAVSRCWHSTQDIDRILNIALPVAPEAYWGAIQFFMSASQPDAAVAAWKKLIATRASFPISRPAPLLDFLIQSDRSNDARAVWRQALSAAGILPSQAPGGSLIWDGGFEQDILNAGFSWRYSPVQGAHVELDEETVHSGARSLRITFDGSANVDFQQIWQYVPVEPGTLYLFSAYIRTQELTTESGIHFEIVGVSPAVATPNVGGTQPWTLENTTFTTGPETHMIRVLLRRGPSNMLSNKICGTAWVDDVSLVPVSVADQGAG